MIEDVLDESTDISMSDDIEEIYSTEDLVGYRNDIVSMKIKKMFFNDCTIAEIEKELAYTDYHSVLVDKDLSYLFGIYCTKAINIYSQLSSKDLPEFLQYRVKESYFIVTKLLSLRTVMLSDNLLEFMIINDIFGLYKEVLITK